MPGERDGPELRVLPQARIARAFAAAQECFEELGFGKPAKLLAHIDWNAVYEEAALLGKEAGSIKLKPKEERGFNVVQLFSAGQEADNRERYVKF